MFNKILANFNENKILSKFWVFRFVKNGLRSSYYIKKKPTPKSNSNFQFCFVLKKVDSLLLYLLVCTFQNKIRDAICLDYGSCILLAANTLEVEERLAEFPLEKMFQILSKKI